MPDRLKPMLLMLGVAALGACHNDPFSIKPEVNVTLPEKPPADAARDEDDSTSGTDESEQVP
ncbi:hypothetical protein [Hyphomonas sp.]|uniref:hypothetical protein n=1 Tax=Hyphomonas sp. TaxID=87 RepID=UPI003528FF00